VSLTRASLVLEHHVAGLDVAMNQPLRVCSGEARRGLHPDPKQLLELERSGVVKTLLQRRTSKRTP